MLPPWAGAAPQRSGRAPAGEDSTGSSNVADRPRPLLRPPPPLPPPPSLALDSAALLAGLALVSIMFSIFAPEAYMVRSRWVVEKETEKRKLSFFSLSPSNSHPLLKKKKPKT